MAEKQQDRSRDPLLRPHRTILQREIEQAESELKRTRHGLFLSGVIAGIGVSLSPLLKATVLSLAGADGSPLLVQFIVANVYAVGFVVVILGRTDLFTEYTTMAILPILAGHAPLRSLGRLWGIVYVANLAGVAAFAALVSVMSGGAHFIDPETAGRMAERLVGASWSIVLLSSVLTGWLMGLLSWLVSAAGDAISQVFYVWIITASIGFIHLHHAISGSGEVLMGIWLGHGPGAADFVFFLTWTTLGNALGGVVFALLIRYSVFIGGPPTKEHSGRRGGGRGDGGGR